MVLMNAVSKARYQSSITNLSSGGGTKKAGGYNMIGLSQWGQIAFHTRGVPLPLSNLQKNRFKIFPNMNLPLGFNPPIRMR